MQRIKAFCLFIFVNVFFLGTAVLVWASIPISVDVTEPDPAIDYINKTYKSPHAFKEGYVEYDGNQLHYVEAGEGEVVLFLHGFPSYWLSHVRQLTALRDTYRVIAIDGLGAGRSSAPKTIDNYRLETMSAHLLHLLDQLGEAKVHLVGHDWGAALAFGFAQRFPERVKTVTGISVPPQNVMVSLLETSDAQRQASSYIEQLKNANLPLLLVLGASNRVYQGAYAPLVERGKLTIPEGELFQEATGPTKRINAHIHWYRANLPSASAIQESNFWPSRAARLDVPALFIWGTDDPIISEDTVEGIEAIADDLTLVPIDEVGHWPHINQPELVTTVIRAHLNQQ